VFLLHAVNPSTPGTLYNRKKNKKISTKGRESGTSQQNENKSGPTWYRCVVCNSGFKEESRLAEHKKRHGHFSDTPERNFKCEICSKSFFRKTHLEDHQRTHSDEKPFQCPECTRGFRQMTSLRRHFKTHTNEKPYGCSVCKGRFKCSSSLRIHERKQHS